MAYCTVPELAAALHIRVTTENAPLLSRCIAAAAEEIDARLDRDEDDPLTQAVEDDVPSTEGVSPTVAADNIFRAVQWFKANDVAAGGGGYTETGLLNAPTAEFKPMSTGIHKQNWGIA